MEKLLKNKYLILAALLLIAFGIFFYRTELTARITGGTIFVTGLNGSEKIFVDNERTRPDINGDTGTLHVPAGERDLLISIDGYWPWLKRISVAEKSETAVYPFLLPKSPEIEAVSADDPEYEALVQYAVNLTAPTANSPIRSKDGKTSAYVEGGSTVYVRWESQEPMPPAFCVNGCNELLTALVSSEPILALDFLKSRNDVLIVRFPAGIYAIEIDARGIQNFEPIYEIPDVPFYKAADGSLYVVDGKNLLWIPLREL